MTDRMDVLSFREGKNGKVFAIRLGSAVPNKKGDGYQCYLDAMPAPVDGQYRISVVPQRERPQGAQQASNAAQDNDSDSIPF
jgi:hypothetical protein